ncbi:MAG: class I SAM-dependent RNA methyltransferase [Deltaproteobacteria bacterium]|nr:class I SAM-dependent RNA methyltransferase [Deltaproteobacteria bacterium]
MTQSVRIDSLAFGGYGVGRLDSGKAVLVTGAAPGDVLSVTIEREKGSHVFATIDSILEPSPDRVEPLCGHADRCGSCSWQHISVATQRRWKHSLIVDELAHAGLLDDPEAVPEVAGGEALGYRTRSRMHLRGGAFGTMQRRSRTVVPFRGCPVLTPELEELALDVSQSIAGAPDADVELYVDTLGQRGMLVALTGASPARAWERIASENGVFSYRIRRPGSPPGPEGRLLFEDSAGTPIAFEPGVFVQTNRDANAILVDRAMDAAGRGGSFAEIYAGAGNFTVHLCSRFEQGHAAEPDPLAARMLRRNMRSSSSTVEVLEKTDAQAARSLCASPAVDVLLADPPRSGMKPLYPVFDSSPPARTVIVSCHPMAAVRDLNHLVNNAGYVLEKVVPVDMFPQTDHLELVAVAALPGA